MLRYSIVLRIYSIHNRINHFNKHNNIVSVARVGQRIASFTLLLIHFSKWIDQAEHSIAVKLHGVLVSQTVEVYNSLIIVNKVLPNFVPSLLATSSTVHYLLVVVLAPLHNKQHNIA